MSLKYLDERDAERICETTFLRWATDSGDKGCPSAQQTRDAVEEMKRWASKSPAAAALMQFVEQAPQEILVVGMR